MGVIENCLNMPVHCDYAGVSLFHERVKATVLEVRTTTHGYRQHQQSVRAYLLVPEEFVMANGSGIVERRISNHHNASLQDKLFPLDLYSVDKKHWFVTMHGTMHIPHENEWKHSDLTFH